MQKGIIKFLIQTGMIIVDSGKSPLELISIQPNDFKNIHISGIKWGTEVVGLDVFMPKSFPDTPASTPP